MRPLAALNTDPNPLYTMDGTPTALETAMSRNYGTMSTIMTNQTFELLYMHGNMQRNVHHSALLPNGGAIDTIRNALEFSLPTSSIMESTALDTTQPYTFGSTDTIMDNTIPVHDNTHGNDAHHSASIMPNGGAADTMDNVLNALLMPVLVYLVTSIINSGSLAMHIAKSIAMDFNKNIITTPALGCDVSASFIGLDSLTLNAITNAPTPYGRMVTVNGFDAG